MRAQCHLCDGALTEFADFHALPRVTSDCRPWPAGGRLACCSTCGAVQKVVDAAWRDEAAEVYAGYALYWQSPSRAEQSVLSGAGEFARRSTRVFEVVRRRGGDASALRYLDFGCGTGETLRIVRPMFPSWSVYGYEPNPRPEAPDGIFTRWDDVPPALDVVSLVHVLEHIPDPVATLRMIAERLSPAGQIVIQVPWYEVNPFDLVIADHCTHFTPTLLARCVRDAGLHVAFVSTTVVQKEITLIASRAPTATDDACSPAEVNVVESLAWLAEVAARARALPDGFGVFGTAIAGVWVAGQRAQVAFFIDEDPSRQGTHGERPVYSIADAPAGVGVFVPLVPGIAAVVAQRLRDGGLAPVLPPQYPRLS